MGNVYARCFAIFYKFRILFLNFETKYRICLVENVAGADSGVSENQK